MANMVIVGWGVMEGDEKCSYCENMSVAYATTKEEPDMHPVCNSCARKAEDRIEKKFEQAFGRLRLPPNEGPK